MKKLIYLLAFAFIASTAFVSCDDDDDNSSPFQTIILGAQESTIDGFYSIIEDKTYDIANAKTNATTIDFLCFYNADKEEMAIGSAGAKLVGVFEAAGDNDPQLWTVADTTYFSQVDVQIFSSIDFAKLTNNSATIVTLFDEETATKKAKQLTAGDIFAFKTEDEIYGVLLVKSVSENATTGHVEFEYIIKK